MQTKEQKAAYMKPYCKANREKLAAYHKAWYSANREKRLAQMKVSYAENRDEYLAHKKVYYAENRYELLAYNKAYAAAHPNEYLANTHKKRAKKAGAKMGDTKAILYWLKGWKTEAPVACHYCKSLSPGTDMTMDHVIPMSAGGDHDLNNLVVCCKSCNSSKQDRLPAEWLAFKAAC